jgi:hypothetical protein
MQVWSSTPPTSGSDRARSPLEGFASAATAPEPSSALKAEIESNYGKLPLSFEANQGQTDSQVKFLARGRGVRPFSDRDRGRAVLG